MPASFHSRPSLTHWLGVPQLGVRARTALLAGTLSSFAAILAGVLVAGAVPEPAAACALNVNGTSGPVNNTGMVDCINISNATVNGDVVNSGPVQPGGITVNNSIVMGQVLDLFRTHRRRHYSGQQEYNSG